jgi:hypothetical protein
MPHRGDAADDGLRNGRLVFGEQDASAFRRHRV